MLVENHSLSIYMKAAGHKSYTVHSQNTHTKLNIEYFHQMMTDIKTSLAAYLSQQCSFYPRHTDSELCRSRFQSVRVRFPEWSKCAGFHDGQWCERLALMGNHLCTTWPQPWVMSGQCKSLQSCLPLMCGCKLPRFQSQGHLENNCFICKAV